MINTSVPSEDERLLTVPEVARRLRVNAGTVRKWVHDGLLEAIILPHRGKRVSYRVRASLIEQIVHQGSHHQEG